MTMKEIAFLLVQMGNEVKYTQRQDGGIRITYINGQRFTGSTGNTSARQMVGATISEARIQQLQKIRTPKGKWGHKKLEDIDDDIKKQIRKAQRIFRKSGISAGKPTIRKYRAVLKEYGREEAQRKLGQAMRYGMGLAYEENVDHLISRLKMDSNESGNPQALEDIIKRIKSMRSTLRESTLKNIVDNEGPMYRWEKGEISTEEMARQINAILDNN